MSKEEGHISYPYRHLLLLVILAGAALISLWRITDLNILSKDFLQNQGDARHLRVVSLAAHRGMITDRNDDPLAVSTPVDSVWANPQVLVMEREQWSRLAVLLNMDVEQLRRRLAGRGDREFVYIRRHIHPQLARKVMALGIPGVSLQREYRRYYPTGEVAAHVVGFTDIDDTGQEGLELAYDEWLRGTPGSKRVIKDRLGHVVENVESIRQPRPGKHLALSIDRRLQYLAYRELKAAVKKNRAKSGSAVILDVATGEVLAMVNQPSYNPNNRRDLRSDRFRNRAVTDVFEPGSTIKPFAVAAALESGKYQSGTRIDTDPGILRVGANTIRDIRNYGIIDVATVIQKSSNVGVSKIALSLHPELLWNLYIRVGIGSATHSGFPGESAGLLPDYHGWRDIERATLAFGYGLSVTTLQLAQAYSIIASDGLLRQVTFLRTETGTDNSVAGSRVLHEPLARQLRHMLEKAVADEGTGRLSQVPGYRVAGKTGTVRKAGIGGYTEDRYIALFAGFAPASRPRLVMAVIVNEPENGDYYGGKVAAPVFSRVMSDALRLMNIAPDDDEFRRLKTADGILAGRSDDT